MKAVAAMLAGAVLLAWPALVNGYPIVFSDTHAFLVMGGEPRMVWDKPFVYGPLLRLLHGNRTLWLPLAGQVLLVSWLLWRVRPGWCHPVLCAVLAVGSAAPWFASTLMPDILAPVVVLALFLIGFSPGRHGVLLVVASVAAASHLAYLPLAAVVGVAAVVLGGRRIVLVPVVAAAGLLVATNLVGHGRFGISPYGSVFALARLVSDGPAQVVLARECPAAGWRMCGWLGRFPADSDAFLWDGQGPVWSDPGGPQGLAAEASAIVRATVLGEPVAVLRSALGNAWEQLGRVRLGDTLGNDWLESSITGSLRAYFPAAEMARFRAGLQMGERLRAVAAPLNPLHIGLLLAGAAACAGLAWRRNALAVLVLAAVLTNAAVSGALSRPHDRYQARIAWLVLLPPLVMLPGVRPGSGRPRIPPSAP